MPKNPEEYWQHNRVSVVPFIQRVAEGDFGDQELRPLAQEFAQILAAPYRSAYEAGEMFWTQITPWEFGLQAARFLQIIRSRGEQDPDERDVGRERYVPPHFFQLTPEAIQDLYLAVPALARLVSSEDFAAEVEQKWDDVLKYWGYKEDLPDRVLEGLIPITTDIHSAKMAKELIIDYTQERIAELDWNWASEGGNFATETITALFQEVYPLLLEDDRLVPALMVLDIQANRDTIAGLDATHHIALGENTSLVLSLGTISPRDATFIRDSLCLLAIDEIAERLGLHQEVAGRLLMANPGLQMATARMLSYIHREG